MKKEPILIVCYTFPPDKGIGGRRWSKFAKYLSKDNYDVHIITLKKRKTDDFNPKLYGLENVHIHEINGFYPKALTKQPKNNWDKIKYKFWMHSLSLLHKGSIYDKSLFMETALKRKMTSLITDFNIKLVFVTCAPFYLAFYAKQLKNNLNFFLTVDFRDPWTWGQSYGYVSISNKRKLYDNEREKEVVEGADLIISPSTEILNHLSNFHAVANTKLLHVPHGVDTENITHTKTKNNAENTLKFIYAGTLYEDYALFLEALIDTLQELKINSPARYASFQFDVYSTSDANHYINIILKAGLQEKIQFYESIPETELFQKIIQYDYSLIYFPEKYKDFISTKFYELIYLKLPIVYVGNQGILSQFISENELGYAIAIDSFKQNFKTILSIKHPKPIDSTFEIEKYTYGNITKEMMREIDVLSCD